MGNDPIGKRYQGKHVLITAGAGSIGSATALRMANEGAARISLVDRDDTIEIVAQQLRSHCPRVDTHRVDCTDESAVRSLCANVLDSHGHVDVLVNGVGGGSEGKHREFVESTSEDWHRIINTTLVSTMSFIRYILPAMRDRKYGRIVNIGSSIALLPTVKMSEYAAAKAGIVGLSRSLALENARHGVTVNVVSPSPIRTGATANIAPDVLACSVDAVPLGRIGEPEEIAAAVAFLGSDDGSFITGQNLAVNGGRALN